VTVRWLVTVKGMKADHAERQQSDQVGEQDEHEEREDVRHELAALRADIRRHHILDKAGHAFHGGLPASGHELALHATEHEQPQRAQRHQHPQR
jgi:hypothetical protein